MKQVLVTGSSGLIGTAVCKKFAEEGWNVIGTDSYQRSQLLDSEDAETKGQIEKIQDEYSNIRQYNYDIRNLDKMRTLIRISDAVVHCAAQVSHPRSLEIPIEDAEINIMGTLNLLEMVRKYRPENPFAFLSSNKVYGDYPNYFNYEKVKNSVYNRYENPVYDSFDESLPIDHCGHTPFGVSKVAADLYVQEYARNYDMKTAAFRGGCLTGKNNRAVEAHGFLGFFTKQILLKEVLNIFGDYYRVRDNIHSSDVAEVVYTWISNPKPDALGCYGKAYNLGGMRENSVSIFETVAAITSKTGIDAELCMKPERKSDHIWWISDMSRFKRDYPQWKLTKDLDFIFNELLENWIEILDLDVELINENYFKELRS
jgi:CDP-paratose 2-epimerase